MTEPAPDWLTTYKNTKATELLRGLQAMGFHGPHDPANRALVVEFVQRIMNDTTVHLSHDTTSPPKDRT